MWEMAVLNMFVGVFLDSFVSVCIRRVFAKCLDDFLCVYLSSLRGDKRLGATPTYLWQAMISPARRMRDRPIQPP